MKVLVAVDNSKCSSYALESVARRAWAEGTEVMLLTVAEPLMPAYGLYIPDEVLQSQARVLKACGKRFKQLSGNSTKVTLIEKLAQGYARKIIPEIAREWQADLVVVGSHGRLGFDHAVLGSVAEQVVHEAPCSVEVIKTPDSSRRPASNTPVTTIEAGAQSDRPQVGETV